MKWYLGKDYIENHLLTYVEFQLNQGYQLEDIRNALLHYGYDTGLVTEVCNRIDPDKYTPSKHSKKSIKEMNEELYVYLQNLLIDSSAT